MRSSTLLLACLLTASIALHGCGRDGTLDAVGTSEDTLAARSSVQQSTGLFPGGYYSTFFSNQTGAYSEFSRIDLNDGAASLVWSIGIDPYPGQSPEQFGPTTFGITFDLDGTMYGTVNLISFDPSLVQSQLARFDVASGTVELIGDPVPFNTAGSEIGPCGTMYVCGFQVNALGYIWGNSNLWRVDKRTGEFHLVGDTGHTNWMDLAFDSKGTLWGTFDNELYTIDTTTGASTFVTHVSGVPDAGPPYFMEVMSIAFDERDQLFGTGLTVLYDHPDGSPVMSIDIETGVATLIGYSMTEIANHGGDTLPTRVRICHRTGKGTYIPMTIALDALEAHRSHGDIVPGVDTESCGCPGARPGKQDLEGR
jgi:hypothetical protein